MKVQNVIDALETIAPPKYAAEWDNVGLLIGSPDWDAGRICLTIDLTEEVLREAINSKAEMIIAYHPPIFHSMTTLTDATVKQHIVLEAARAGIAVYSPHTALDSTPSGMNDWLAEGFGKGDVRAIEPYKSLPQSEECKIITFCPADAVDAIRNGLGTVGAGRIGDYQLCSFELRGQGTFFGGESTNPVVGDKGHLERVDEVRLEMVCSESALGLAVIALREFHPYEEPPIEIYKLHTWPERRIGHGRRLVLDQRASLETLVERIKQRINVPRVRVAVSRDAPETYHTIGVCAGSGGDLIDQAIEQGCTLYFTGEMNHHKVIDAQARGCTVVLAGHTNTERGYLPLLRKKISEHLADATINVAGADTDPLLPM